MLLSTVVNDFDILIDPQKYLKTVIDIALAYQTHIKFEEWVVFSVSFRAEFLPCICIVWFCETFSKLTIDQKWNIQWEKKSM